MCFHRDSTPRLLYTSGPRLAVAPERILIPIRSLMTKTSSATASASPSLSLSFAFEFADLYRREGLVRLDQVFLEHLGESAPALADRLREARAHPDSIELRSESELLIALAPHLEDFIAELFKI